MDSLHSILENPLCSALGVKLRNFLSTELVHKLRRKSWFILDLWKYLLEISCRVLLKVSWQSLCECAFVSFDDFWWSLCKLPTHNKRTLTLLQIHWHCLDDANELFQFCLLTCVWFWFERVLNRPSFNWRSVIFSTWQWNHTPWISQNELALGKEALTWGWERHIVSVIFCLLL